MNKKIIFSLASILLLSACNGLGTSDLTGVEAEKYTLGNGPVLIEEFADFQCPACGQVSPIVKAYALQNPDVVTFEYNHFPLSQHPNAIPAAIAAECGGLQGDFWGVEQRLFENQDNLGDELYMGIAKELGFDEVEFKTCLANESIQKKVLASAKEGRDREVNATPTLFVSVAGEEPQKIQFSADFFNFVEQKAKSAGSGNSTPSAQDNPVEVEDEDSTSVSDEDSTNLDESSTESAQ